MKLFLIVSLLVAFLFASCQTAQESYARKHFKGVFKDSSGQIIELEMNDGSLRDISFLDSFPHLKSLDLTCYDITDYTPLSKLHELSFLLLYHLEGLHEDQRPSMDFLSGLTNLQDLSLIEGSVGPLNSFKYLVNLRSLLLSVSYPSVEPVKYLKNLRKLDIDDGPQFSDLTPIGDLSNLESLTIHFNNKITDLTPLAKLKHLKYLDISSPLVSDISPLAGCSSLQTLILGANHLVSLQPLKSLKNLVALAIPVSRKQEEELFKIIPNLPNLKGFSDSYQLDQKVWKMFHIGIF